MKSVSEEIKVEHHHQVNYLYYMCLIDWSGVIIDESKHKLIAKSLMPEGQQTEGWRITWNEYTQLTDCGINSGFLSGFYHSRVILRFELTSCPKTISEVREIRQDVESFVEKYLVDNVISMSRECLETLPKAFIYPVFELTANCPIWRFKRNSPYTLATTCFYTDLRDTEQPRWSMLKLPLIRRVAQAFLPATVKMRISGAKIITSPMSDWFFWNLTNLIYHEGLYRTCREQNIVGGEVYKGIENRLEDFADRLMASFSQSITNVVLRRLNWWLVLLTILLIALTVSLIVISIINEMVIRVVIE